jgi:ABC-2 type transport system permease protein
MSPRHIWAVIRKELRYIVRDRGTLLIVLLTPTMLLVIMGYALTADIEHVPVIAIDLDQTSTSRSFLSHLNIGAEIDLTVSGSTFGEAEQLLTAGKADALITIPPGFERQLFRVAGMPLQVLVDGTEPQTGGFAVDEIGKKSKSFLYGFLNREFPELEISKESLEPITLDVRAWYNPQLEPRVDLVPGLMAMVLGMPGISIALTLAREREHGTLEQLLATPIGRAELLLGKMGPYVVTGLFNVVLTAAVAVIWFGAPLRGSFPLYLLLSAIYYFALLSLGTILGTVIRSQAAAMALAFLVIFFPGFFLTGIFFPSVSLPAIVQLEALGLPGTHYARITSYVFVIGAGWKAVWPFALGLFGLGTGFTMIAAFFFRKKLA